MDLIKIEKMLKPFGSVETVHEKFIVFSLRERPHVEILESLEYALVPRREAPYLSLIVYGVKE